MRTHRRATPYLFLLPHGAFFLAFVAAVVWRWVLLYDNGLLNHGLAALGTDKVPWLTEQPGAWFGIVAATVWCTVGWNMILLLVGLQQIPITLYEAAALDGAGPWRTFRDITLYSPGMRTMPVGMATLQGRYIHFYGKMMAGALLIAIPSMVLFILVQRYYVRSIAQEGPAPA